MMDKKEDHSLGVGGLGCDGPGPWVIGPGPGPEFLLFCSVLNPDFLIYLIQMRFIRMGRTWTLADSWVCGQLGRR